MSTLRTLGITPPSNRFQQYTTQSQSLVSVFRTERHPIRTQRRDLDVLFSDYEKGVLSESL